MESAEFKFIPLGPDPKMVVTSYPKYNWILAQNNKLDSLNYEEVCELEDEMIKFQNHYMRSMGMIIELGPKPYDAILKPIYERRKQLLQESNMYAKKFYDNPINTKETEEVNGYKLYEVNHLIMSFEVFEELRQLMKNDKKITRDEFYEWYEENACSDWAKQDRHGECYGGFWKYPDGTEERDNAYNLSKEDNFQGLWELPYPKDMIKLTVEMGCSNRMESVRYSNFICEWVKRMSTVVYLINKDVS